MKKNLTIFSFLVAAILLSSITFAAGKPIKICVEIYEPFVIKMQNNRLSGFDVDLMSAMCSANGKTCNFVIKDFSKFISQLNANECDAWVSGITVTQERRKYIEFSDIYYYSAVNFITRNFVNFDASVKGFRGKTIGVEDGSNFVYYLYATYGNNIKIKKYSDIDIALAALKNNQIDAVIADTPVLAYWMRQNGASNYKLLDLIATNQEYSLGSGYGVAFKKGNVAGQSDFNNALIKIKESGVYRAIRDKYSAFKL